MGVALWTDIEEHVGFWVACFQPLVRLIFVKVGLSSASQSNTHRITTRQTYTQRLRIGPTIKSRANLSYYEDSESSKGIFELDQRDRGTESPMVTANSIGQTKNTLQDDLEGVIWRVVQVDICQEKI